MTQLLGDDLQWARESLLLRYREVRAQSEQLCEPLEVEDYVIQAMAEVSPPKWHMAHTSWFFETFLLKPLLRGYREFHPAYAQLFNSYYNSIGRQWPRPQRGLLSRPTVREVYDYRAHVDEGMEELFQRAGNGDWIMISERLALGLHHEQQHQELLLTDIKYNLSVNPLAPAYRSALTVVRAAAAPHGWQPFGGGEFEVGHEGSGFAFDNEGPRHRVLLDDFRLATRAVTNGDYADFIAEGGYQRPEFWLSDGWALSQRERWQAPLHWRREGNNGWQEFTLGGLRPLVAAEPVCHVSYYEADAYARWAGKRLPREEEWEVAAQSLPPEGNMLVSGALHPMPAQGHGMLQLFGDVWEWTQSAYTPYPGYRPAPGAFGEYNGKFMCNQLVLRGGSCVTPPDHIRATYRNFFYPHDRWQFTGIRLAE